MSIHESERKSVLPKALGWVVMTVLWCLAFLPVQVSSAEAAGGKIGVFVSVLPQAYFAERVGGDRVEVNVLVGPGQSPHTFEPTPKQMARLGSAALFFRVGVPFENSLVPKIARSFPGLKIVDTSKGVKLLALAHHDDHDQGEEGDHGHEEGAPDPHIWLDPARVRIQARNMGEALVSIDPVNAAYYRANLAAFTADLDRLDARLRRILAPVKGSKIYVFHPAFGYLADAYGFTQVPVEIEGKEPGARELAKLISQAKADGVKVIFVQPQFSAKNARAVAREIGGTVVPIDPLPRDFISEMERTARTIEASTLKK